MAEELSSNQPDGPRSVRVAFEGCGHGKLNSIYASIEKTCEINKWDGVDLLIIGGDFQAVRNEYDLNTVVLPQKYRHMGDFHEYYSGKRKAPYLTLFIGGNHEAINHLLELYYGGWVAPNIYYLGAANVVRFGPLRIAALSGIWKGYSYSQPHHERLPYSQEGLRTAYHVREYDTRKLLQLTTQVDLGLSHDWPRGVEWLGDTKKLFGRHAHLQEDARNGTLGNVAAKIVMDRLRPFYWFSAHFHCKYTAVIDYLPEDKKDEVVNMSQKENAPVPAPGPAADDPEGLANPDEIDIDLSEDETSVPAPATLLEPTQPSEGGRTSAVPIDLRQQLPEAFQKRAKESRSDNAPIPAEITNLQTRFLALDKCLPGREFLQILELDGSTGAASSPPYKLEYDKEWLAITRVFAPDLVIGDPLASVPRDKGQEAYRAQIEEESQWVEEHIVQQDRMTIPENFEIVAPVYDPNAALKFNNQGREYSNPQTVAFCELLGISNPLHLSEETMLKRAANGPPKTSNGQTRRGGVSGERSQGRGFFRGGRGRGRP